LLVIRKQQAAELYFFVFSKNTGRSKPREVARFARFWVVGKIPIVSGPTLNYNG